MVGEKVRQLSGLCVSSGAGAGAVLVIPFSE